MGGAETFGATDGRNLTDARRAPPGVATRILSEASSGRSGGIGIDVGARGGGERDRWQERGRVGRIGGEGVDEMEDGGGADPYSITGRRTRGGGDLAGGVPDPQRGR